MSNKLNAGSTLIEALVAILIVGLVLTAIASVLSFSVKNNAQADYRTMASGIAQDGVEWLRQKRAELGWTSFYTNIPAGTLLCFPKSATGLGNISGTSCEGNYETTNPPASFTRKVTISKVSTPFPKVVVMTRVSWKDGDAERNVEVQYDFYKF